MRDLVIFAALIYGGWALSNGSLKLPINTPGPPAVVSPPSAEVQAIVKPVIGRVSSADNKQEISALLVAWADALERDEATPDGGVFKSVSGFQQGTKRYGRVAAQKTPFASDWNAIDQDIEEGILKMFGNDDKPLDGPATRQLCEVLRGFAWAVAQ